jgi:hypothetical protein
MNLIKSLSLFSTTVIGMGVLAAVPQIAQANTEVGGDTDAGGYVLTDNGAGADVLSGTISTTFTFLDTTYTGAPSAPFTGATLTISGTSSGTVSQTPIGGTTYDSLNFTNIDFTYKEGASTIFTAVADNVVLDTPAQLIGVDGGNGATLTTTSAAGPPPTVVTLSSPYIASGILSDPETLSFSLSGINSAGGGLVVGGDGLFESFTASGDANFSAVVPTTPFGGSTPEPSPAIAIGIASAGLLGLLLFNKKRSSDLA